MAGPSITLNVYMGKGQYKAQTQPRPAGPKKRMVRKPRRVARKQTINRPVVYP